MLFVGIDPGLRGGIAILAEGRAEAVPLPISGGQLDLSELAAILRAHPAASLLAVVEQGQAMPEQGVSSSFKFGWGCGAVAGVLAALGIRTELVRSTVWKKIVLAGFGDKDKDAAIAYCRRAFPTVELVQPGCRTPHDGAADALCIAEFGRRVYGGLQPFVSASGQQSLVGAA